MSQGAESLSPNEFRILAIIIRLLRIRNIVLGIRVYEGENMELSTTTLIETRTGMYGAKESIDLCRRAGFHVLDFNFCRFCRGEGFMKKADWKDELGRILEYANERDVVFTQAHGFLPKGTAHDHEYNRNMFIRTIEGAAVLGIKRIVLHPVSIYMDGKLSLPESLKTNLEDIKWYLDTAHRVQVDVAIENLFDMNGTLNYASDLDNLLEIIDRVQNDALGVCYDFGHANLCGWKHRDALTRIGNHLKAVHVNDNDGRSDQHLFPGFGITDWREAVRTLKEIDFQGDFTYEAHTVTGNMDELFHLSILKYGAEIGRILLSKCGEACR